MLKKLSLAVCAVVLAFSTPQAYASHYDSVPRVGMRGMHTVKTHVPSQATDNIFIPTGDAMQYHLYKINKRYQKALQKIAASSLSQPVRELLIKQAAENRNLAVKQMQEKVRLCSQHACERLPYRCELLKDKNALKILKKIDNI